MMMKSLNDIMLSKDIPRVNVISGYILIASSNVKFEEEATPRNAEARS